MIVGFLSGKMIAIIHIGSIGAYSFSILNMVLLMISIGIEFVTFKVVYILLFSMTLVELDGVEMDDGFFKDIPFADLNDRSRLANSVSSRNSVVQMLRNSN
jgi:hypothetical protein